ncbi:phytanoyl-CoA dioxygenase [Polyangium jinanense]|uniref:Phytanoyl-CoA dioxygenase n=1 Tax=Polyangium jinanense TaxID=2829994 RepID=A0A9X4AW95_9BACT|nr:phytanoyl-CoA dioxygenase [Polyangium jinanense]MDC3956967.1 phytanoyl-CoA dioxygenase [Polyangium jinanense]MDC3987124.1 phytanoyl-CoA dioxygenase [Polyangium jinanense]
MPHRQFALSGAQIDQFVHEGYVRIDDAFPRDLADACRAILWAATGCSPDDPSTWTKPVIRIGDQAHPPFRAAVNTTKLLAAFDSLVGVDRWLPRASLGTFPIRFPSPDEPGDCGWHIDASFGWENEPDFFAWRANVASKGRALLMLFLFSDVGDDDAPTRLRIGSHAEIARRLAPHGEGGLTLRELVSTDFRESAHLPEALATGPAGTVYLCHPFLVHAGQPHRGRVPRFLAQPPLLPRVPFEPTRTDGNDSPVERAIRLALD